MAFAQHDSAPRSIAEMNITPLVDVMLVLLVIFMVTTPVLSKPINFDLPQAGPDQEPARKDEPIRLRIAASGEIFWNDNLTPVSALPAMMRGEIARAGEQPPMLQIDANGDSDYQVVATVMAVARNAGMTRLGFVRR